MSRPRQPQVTLKCRIRAWVSHIVGLTPFDPFVIFVSSPQFERSRARPLASVNLRQGYGRPWPTLAPTS
jgi:hypothetical protein